MGSLIRLDTTLTESSYTVPKNSVDEKNCADGAKLCTNETEPSVSQRKIMNMDISYSDEAFSGFRNVVMDINLLAWLFFDAVKCIKCENTGLRLHLSESNCGEAVKFHLKCPSCTNITIFFLIQRNAIVATRETGDYSIAEAVREAFDENDGKRDLAVAVDGSWQKRGFVSKNGLVTVTSFDSGKVIDVEVFSKQCICPNKTKHLQNCKRNFEAITVRWKRERERVAGALSIFQRSLSLYNVRYTKYLGDGDSKAFTSIVEKNAYGDHCSVEKLECIGHVKKRMGTRLRRLKTKMRGQKLSDGKPLCGKNRLTEAEIDRH
ncbi:uncharacterized protein TNCV_652121 [Trichonephila clavipes]|nr:uncharacterized protein TNCV_652121 [Trichonephila clavipes]